MSEPEKKNKENRLIAIGVSLWVSFLSAGAAAMLFFATFDPSIIAQVATYPMSISRTTGYSLGFLLFWLLLVLNSLLVIWLANRNPNK